MKKRIFAFFLVLILSLSFQNECIASALDNRLEEVQIDGYSKKISNEGYRFSKYYENGDPAYVMPSTGNLKMPVLILSFSDCPEFTESERQALDDHYNGEFNEEKAQVEGAFTQSVHGAFQALSYGRLNLTADLFFYRAEHPGSYYATSSMVKELQKAALEYFLSSGDLNPRNYDSNRDGWVDGFIIHYQFLPSSMPSVPFLAGEMGFFSKNVIADISDKSKEACVDGFWTHARIFDSNNMEFTLANTETEVHEILHMMGLPDHYGYKAPQTSGSVTHYRNEAWIDIGLADIMCAPTFNLYLNAYSKILLGWIDPIILTKEEALSNRIELSAVENYTDTETPKAVVLIPDSTLFPFTEFFVAEYRNATQTGHVSPSGTTDYHKNIYDHPGVVIWHCDTERKMTEGKYGWYQREWQYIMPVYKSGRRRDPKDETHPSIFSADDLYTNESDQYGYTTYFGTGCQEPGYRADYRNALYSGRLTDAYLAVMDMDNDKAVIDAGFSKGFQTGEPVIEITNLENVSVDIAKSIANGEMYQKPLFQADIKDGASGNLISVFEDDFKINEDLIVFTGVLEGFKKRDVTAPKNQELYDILIWPSQFPSLDEKNGVGNIVFLDGAVSWNGRFSKKTVSEPFYIDTLPPGLTLNGEPTLTVERGMEYEEPGAEITDNLDPDIIAGKLNGKLTIDTSEVNTEKVGTYTVTYTAEDWAKNTATAERKVMVVDTIAPTATVEYSTTRPTNGDVVATITPSEDVTVTNNGGSLSHTFTENGSFTFEFKDGAGNKGTATATVDWIDKSLPAGTISYSITEMTNQDVTATLSVSSGITILNNGGSNTYTFTKNGSFAFEIQNAAGTKATIAASVNWIDKEPPVITLKGKEQVELHCEEVYVEKGVTVTDDQDSEIESKLKVISTIREKVPGTYTVTYSVTDHAGNTAEKVRTVTVSHNLSYVPETSVTCTTDGEKAHWSCEQCGKLFEEEQGNNEITPESIIVPSKGHTPGEAAACTKAQTCTVCGEELTAALGHLPDRDAPDCTNDQICTRCHTVLAEKLGHSWGEWEQTKVPTVSEFGEARRDCSRCGEFETKELPKHVHTEETDPEVPATCTKTGLTAGTHCPECGMVLKKQEIIPVLGHAYGSWQKIKAPTCTDQGEEKRTCSRCQKEETRKTAAKEHQYRSAVTNPTCTERGFTEYTCFVCGDNYRDDYTEALNHDFGAWQQTKAPTCKEPGTEKRICSRCSKTETREASKIDHIPGEWQIWNSPTTTREGEEVRKCTMCGVIVDRRSIPKLEPTPTPTTDPTPTPTPDPTPTPTPEPTPTTKPTSPPVIPDPGPVDPGPGPMPDPGPVEPDPQPVELPFTDVKEGAWYYDAVSWAYGEKIISGTSETTFSPNVTTTRGMIVTILWRMENKPQSTASMGFTDVKLGAYYYEAVRWAAENGIVAGRSETKYAPNDPVTRQELAVILYRYAGSPVSEGSLDKFADRNKVSNFAKPALCWAVEQGIISGKGNGILDPKGRATRAEVASMLMRYCKQ